MPTIHTFLLEQDSIQFILGNLSPYFSFFFFTLFPFSWRIFMFSFAKAWLIFQLGI